MVRVPTFLLPKKKVSHYEKLLAKWTKRHKKIQENFWYKHGAVLHQFSDSTKSFLVGSLAGLALLASPGSALHTTTPAAAQEKHFADLSGPASLMLELTSFLPREVRPLTPNEEQQVLATLSQHFTFPIQAQLQGIRLNTSYGYIGQEQHLYRYPGDTIDGHDLPSFGLAPGLGAYGYFARSSQMTEEENLREKYYIAVQTFLSPGYNENTVRYNKFFEFRKMLVVNPDNGKALIADIGDAGPAAWTGKSLGGSPEAMQYLERVDGAGKGPVLYFFIDDPLNKIPLGPIEYN